MLLTRSIKSLVPRQIRRAARRIVSRSVPDPVQAWRRLGVLWEAECIERGDESLKVRGWMIAPDHEGLTLTANGQPVRQIEYSIRPDIEAQHLVLAAAQAVRITGFEALWEGEAPAEPFTCPAQMMLTARQEPRPPVGRPSSLSRDWVKIGFERDGNPIGANFWGCLGGTSHPSPEPARRERLHGQADLAKFRVAGATAFAQLREGLRAVTGLNYADLPDVLDFGCGCGRTTRYFADLPVRITGVDVLAENVAWMRQHLPCGRYEVIPQQPPTALPAVSFDLAIGVSTFTYLTEDRQHEWLDELRRVVRPGGYLLMTVQGETALELGRVSLRQYRRLRRVGIVDHLEEGPDGYHSELGDYRGTFHSEDYLRREWGRYFNVLAVLPGQCGLQDLVVLRRI